MLPGSQNHTEIGLCSSTSAKADCMAILGLNAETAVPTQNAAVGFQAWSSGLVCTPLSWPKTLLLKSSKGALTGSYYSYDIGPI